MIDATIKHASKPLRLRRVSLRTWFRPPSASRAGRAAPGSIHPTAIVHPKARLAAGVVIGPWSIIGAEVEIGESTWVGPHVVIEGPTRIGRANTIYPFNSIGHDPQDKKFEGERTLLEIGDRNVIREFCTFHRGTRAGRSLTRVGDDNLIMAYVHVAHDCEVGSHVTMANGTTLAGCVTVENHACLGLSTVIHQFCLVGAHSFSGMGSIVLKDVPPYTTVSGNPARPRTLNTTGLKRHGMRQETIMMLTRAFKLIYRRGLTVRQAGSELKALAAECPEVNRFIEFLERSSRGTIR